MAHSADASSRVISSSFVDLYMGHVNRIIAEVIPKLRIFENDKEICPHSVSWEWNYEVVINRTYIMMAYQ